MVEMHLCKARLICMTAAYVLKRFSVCPDHFFSCIFFSPLETNCGFPRCLLPSSAVHGELSW